MKWIQLQKKLLNFFFYVFLEFVKKQEVGESENSECDSDDHGTPLAWIKPILLKLTFQTFRTDFLLE